MEKVRAPGITGKLAGWLEEWLSDRHQRVVVNGAFSNWEIVLSGVPQDSVLGPILFLICINNLGKNICSTVFKFVDDTMLVAIVDSSHAVSNLRRDLCFLVDWSQEWLVYLVTVDCSLT